MADKAELLEALSRLADDARLPCAAVLELARRRGVPAHELGRLATEAGLKISDCQLGCFGRHKL